MLSRHHSQGVLASQDNKQKEGADGLGMRQRTSSKGGSIAQALKARSIGLWQGPMTARDQPRLTDALPTRRGNGVERHSHVAFCNQFRARSASMCSSMSSGVWTTGLVLPLAAKPQRR